MRPLDYSCYAGAVCSCLLRPIWCASGWDPQRQVAAARHRRTASDATGWPRAVRRVTSWLGPQNCHACAVNGTGVSGRDGGLLDGKVASLLTFPSRVLSSPWRRTFLRGHVLTRAESPRSSRNRPDSRTPVIRGVSDGPHHLFYQHRVDPDVPIRGRCGCRERADRKRQGIAFRPLRSCPDTIRQAHAVQPVAAVQTEYSLMNRDRKRMACSIPARIGNRLCAWGPNWHGLSDAEA